MSDNDYTYWRLALQGDAPSLSPAEADHAQCGFWRVRSGSIAVWPEVDRSYLYKINNGNVQRSNDGLPIVHGFGFALPVSHEDYTHYLVHGVWPGEIPGLGHNTGQLSHFQEWQENIKGQIADAVRWLKGKGGNLTTQVDADTAANYRDSIRKLCKKGEALQKEEREPLDLQIKEIRQRWGDPLDEAETAIKIMREAVGAFLAAESAREDQRAFEENKRLAEERRALEDQDITLAALEQPVEMVKPKKVGAGGQLGRKTGLKDVYKPDIVDYSKCLEFFRDYPAVREAVDKLCAAEARSKTRREIPGLRYVKIKEAI